MEGPGWLIVAVIVLYLVYVFLRRVRSYQANLRLVKSIGLPYESQFIPHYALPLRLAPKLFSWIFYTSDLFHRLEFEQLFRKHDTGILAIVSSSSMDVYVK